MKLPLRAIAFILVIGSSVAAAETGVTDKTILIGQTVGLTGPAASSVKELNDGANAFFTSINSKGGIHGRTIKLITYDDQFKPAIAAANAEKLITEDNVFALFLNRGTPHTTGIIPLLQKYQIPLIAPSTGATSLHDPVIPMIFNVRTKYQDEVINSLRHYQLLGVKNIGTWYSNDPFGKDVLDGYVKGIERYKLTSLIARKFNPAAPDPDAAADAIILADPQVLILLAPAAPAIELVKAVRAKGGKMQIVALSNNSSAGFIKALGANAPGMVISQVMPAPDIVTSELSREFQAAAKTTGIAPSYASMEGYVAAKVLTEGLRRAGRSLTRAGLVSALETMKNVDLGGLRVNYSPTSHGGSDFVDLTMINKRGQYIR